jgi:hypothetical protein
LSSPDAATTNTNSKLVQMGTSINEKALHFKRQSPTLNVTAISSLTQQKTAHFDTWNYAKESRPYSGLNLLLLAIIVQIRFEVTFTIIKTT